MTTRATLTAFGAAALIFSGADARAEALTMLSSWDDSYSAVPVFAQAFAERLAEKSDGEVTVQMRGPESVPPFEQLQPVATGLFDMLFTHGAYHLGETAMASARAPRYAWAIRLVGGAADQHAGGDRLRATGVA